MSNHTRNLLTSALAVLAGTLLLASAGFAQDEFFEGEFAEGANFTPDFVTVEELKKMIDEGAQGIVVVDNAPAMAYDEEHIPGAISYPWVRNITPPVTLPRNKTLVLYCPCGPDDADSIDMAKKLRMFGYFRVKVLHGGWFKWQDMGYPTEGTAEDEDA